MNEIDPAALARALGEIPLFREIQRILQTQAGPVNWEMAQQIAHAVAAAEAGSEEPSQEEAREIQDDCRTAELALVEHTGMEPSEALLDAELVDRRTWVGHNLAAFRPLVERLAIRLRGNMSQSGGGLNVVFDALGPLLLGLQVGFLGGYLSRRVLGQYELLLPGTTGKLLFVHPNIRQLESELSFDVRQFRMWLSLHEVTHRLEFDSVTWTRPYFTGLIERYIDSAEVDEAGIAEKLTSIGDQDQMSRLMEHPEELLPLLMTPAQRGIVEEMQNFMSLLEGYAEWAMDSVGSRLLPDFGRMREGMNRRRAERSAVESLLEKWLGLDLKMEQYRAGERFVREVAATGHTHALWQDPTSIPKADELQEPSKWLARVVYG